MNSTTLNISDPCPADWGAMTGCEAKRFCAQCTKSVHDLSAMTREAAEVLVTTHNDLCVRYAVKPDGEILFREPAPRSRRRVALRAAVGAVLLASTPAFASGVVAEAEGPNLLDRVVDQVRGFLGIQEEAPPVGCALTPAPVTPVSPETIPELGNLIATPIEPPGQELTVMMGDLAYEPPPPVRMGKIARPR